MHHVTLSIGFEGKCPVDLSLGCQVDIPVALCGDNKCATCVSIHRLILSTCKLVIG